MFSLMPWRRTELIPRTERFLDWMPEEFERMWNRFVNMPLTEMTGPSYRWDMTTEERENETLVRAELPGFTPEEVRVELLGNRLTIEAEHNTAPPAEGAAEARTEREHVHVRRVITVPEGIDPEKVEANYRNGVLEVHLPRVPGAVPRRIAVKT